MWPITRRDGPQAMELTDIDLNLRVLLDRLVVAGRREHPREIRSGAQELSAQR